MRLSYGTDRVRKTLIAEDGAPILESYENARTGRKYTSRGGAVVLAASKYGKRRVCRFCDMKLTAHDEKSYTLVDEGAGVEVRTDIDSAERGVLRERVSLRVKGDPFVVRAVLGEVDIAENSFVWQAPYGKRVFVPSSVARLGQPVYLGDLFLGAETPVAENGATADAASSVYHCARRFSELAKDGVYSPPAFVIGAAEKGGFDAVSDEFLRYIADMAVSDAFRVQFNSWYDHMLDIDSEKIATSFTAVAEGMKGAGFRPLDCYVVDDGWTEYDKPLFWEFNKKFEGGFAKESELTRSLGGKFGVWFGPRGGYTIQTPKFARHLAKIGYHVNPASNDICTGDPRYVADLCDRMAKFCDEFNVDYFKIDGFAFKSCPSGKHGHPSSIFNVRGFYTYLWERWLDGFAAIRRANPKVCLNVTSYAHCSPWFLKWADFIWMNNASDMGFVGEGDSLERCLNYRDSRYRSLFVDDMRQFPAGSLYNHEPCYAARNVDPKFPKKTVVYTDEQFKKYMLCCLMRGSGLAELYFSPSMMDGDKWNIAARALEWAESRHGILKYSRFFGGDPAKGQPYGYYAENDGGDSVLMTRNPSSSAVVFDAALPDGSRRKFDLAPFEVSIVENVGGKEFEILHEKGKN